MERGKGVAPHRLPLCRCCASLHHRPHVTREFLFLPEHKNLVTKLHTFLNQVEKQYHLGRVLQYSSLVISQKVLGL